MKNRIGRVLAICLLATLALDTLTPAQSEAPKAEAPAGETQKARTRIPFNGKLGSVDKSAMTITLDGKTKKRVIHITPQTRIMKSGKAATLEDAVPGEPVGGQALKAVDGREEAVSLRLGPKPEAKEKAANQDEPGAQAQK